MDQIKTGKFIAQKRKEQGLTQPELAEQLGIGDKAVSKWECGRGMPDNSIMIPLCNLLGINVNELLSGESLSIQDYNEKAEDNMIALMEEKELLKKGSRKKNVVSGIFTILLIAVLSVMVSLPIDILTVWLYIFDAASIIMEFVFVLIMLLVAGTVKAFFRSFQFVRKKEKETEGIVISLHAVKLAIDSFLLGGTLKTVLSLIISLKIQSEMSIRASLLVSFVSLF